MHVREFEVASVVPVSPRALEAVAGGCGVTDRVRFEPRLPVGGRVLLALFRFVFRHRHRRLGRVFAAEERWQRH